MPSEECGMAIRGLIDRIQEAATAKETHSMAAHNCRLHHIETECFKLPTLIKSDRELDDIISGKINLLIKNCAENGDPREYLPYGLTEAEKSNPEVLRKLSSCIKDVEKKNCPESALNLGGKYDYSKCSANPVAVCRASVERLIENLIEK